MKASQKDRTRDFKIIKLDPLTTRPQTLCRGLELQGSIKYTFHMVFIMGFQLQKISPIKLQIYTYRSEFIINFRYFFSVRRGQFYVVKNEKFVWTIKNITLE